MYVIVKYFSIHMLNMSASVSCCYFHSNKTKFQCEIYILCETVINLWPYSKSGWIGTQANNYYASLMLHTVTYDMLSIDKCVAIIFMLTLNVCELYASYSC